MSVASKIGGGAVVLAGLAAVAASLLNGRHKLVSTLAQKCLLGSGIAGAAFGVILFSACVEKVPRKEEGIPVLGDYEKYVTLVTPIHTYEDSYQRLMGFRIAHLDTRLLSNT